MRSEYANLCRILLPGLLLAASGCEASKVCDARLRLITVEVKAPEDLTVARVTAENRVLDTCESSEGDMGPSTGSGKFVCGEQGGGGEYEFAVVADDGRRWTQTVEIEHDGCHIVDDDEVVFDLTATEPD